MASLDEIRAKLLAQQTKTENRNSGGGDKGMYPFWNTPEGKTSTLRFLPDGDTNNTFFWVERLVIKIPFQGVKGEHDNEVTVQVPCMEMYGKSCPIIAETKPWWKDESLKDLARKYWKKKSYIFQGFVIDSAFEEKDLPENPIRRFAINSSIFDIIKGCLMDPDVETNPTDYVGGREFRLTKTTKGGFANYGTSKWAMKETALAPRHQDAIEKFGLFNLREFLPKEPSAEELDAIKDMFAASVNEQAYDPARWGQYYKPFGLNTGNAQSSNSAPTTSRASAPAAEVEDDEPVAPARPARQEAPAATSTGTRDPMEILRQLKARQG